MASWVTHLMIADKILERFPQLHRRGFCVGNIAPDCNIENEDWTAFTPSREITHWMQGEKKQSTDCEVFCEEYILKRRTCISSDEEYACLIGYYVHLIVDAAYQSMIRDENRVRAVWNRIRQDHTLYEKSMGMVPTWDSVKILLTKSRMTREIHTLEAEYLNKHPQSGYLTEILPLGQFPDYIDYLPKGSIVRKIGVMGYLPSAEAFPGPLISVSREEYVAFIDNTVCLAVSKIHDRSLL